MSELVSILIPAYNAEKWIAGTIKSALHQTWVNKEIIIVDDGSTDATFQIAKAFESKTVKVITQRNKGASCARNNALSLSQGNYLQFLDADDLLAPDKISQQLKGADSGLESPILLSSAWGRFFSYPNCAQFKPDSLWQDLDPADWIINKFNDNTFMVPSAWLVSRKLIGQAGYWDERLSLDDDGEYACRIMTACEKVKFVPEAKSYYRVGNFQSLSSVISNKALYSQFLSICLCIGHLKSLEESERTKHACLQFLNDSFYLFYPENDELIKSTRNLAASLGLELPTPVRHWRSGLFGAMFGRKAAQKAKRACNNFKAEGFKLRESIANIFSNMP